MRKAPLGFLASLFLAAATPVSAQFTAELVSNAGYWNDGKAEFNIYDAQIMRYGQPRQTEVIHVLVREPFDLKQYVKPDNWQRPGVIQVLKLNQILHVPTGIYLYQQMHSNFWRADNARLAKFSLTSNDSCGNTYKEARRYGEVFSYEWHTYWDGMAQGRLRMRLPPNGYFYDELPLRVRTMDFQNQPTGDFEIQMAPTIINSKRDDFAWKPAQVHYETGEHGIYVTVQHAGGTDHFLLDRNFPYLLRQWDQADGSRLQLKYSLRIDYWNYHGLGDRRRALLNATAPH
jgi:hypothetical protein